MSYRRRDWLTAVALAAVACAVFWPALRGEFLSYDDPDYVTGNPHVRQGLNADDALRAFTTFQVANWHPLTWLSLQLDGTLWKTSDGEPDAWGFHLTNVLLHAGCAALLFLALQSLTGDYWPSAVAALFFAIHPLRVESVAWVAERKDVLSLLFGMLALWAYAGYARVPTRARLLTVAACFALSLLAKPTLVALPFLLLVLDWWPLGRVRLRSDWIGLVGEKLPLFVLTLASCFLTIVAQVGGGATRGLETYSLAVRIETALAGYAFYAAKTVWPFGLAAFYPHPGANLPSVQIWGGAVLLASMTAVALVLRRRAPYLLAGWLWYLGMLVPVLGLVQVGNQVYADRYSYFPQIGLLLAICWGAADVTANRSAVALTAAAAVAVALLARTEDQLRTWHDSEALWQHAIKVTGENPTALISLGYVAETRGQSSRAESYYRRALELDPDSFLAHLNLGTKLAREGKKEPAEAHLERACALAPKFATARLRLGQLRLDQNKRDEARCLFEETVHQAPDCGEAYYQLARMALEAGQNDRAVAYLRETLRWQPDYPEAHYWLAKLMFLKGSSDECAVYLRAELRQNPTSADAHLLLGQVLEKSKDPGGALQQFAEAVRLNPKLAEGWYCLGLACASQGRGADAEACLTRAVTLDPGATPFKVALAVVLDGLAAAQAGDGHARDAAGTERRARDLAAAADRPDLLKKIEDNLRRYERGETGRPPAGAAP
jgi:tetratricopeptide (TPR) repeat protein